MFPRTRRRWLYVINGTIQQAAAVRFAAATVLEPASQFGRAALDELHQQTVTLLSFQSMPRELYDAQAAYNLLSGLGEPRRSIWVLRGPHSPPCRSAVRRDAGRRWRCN